MRASVTTLHGRCRGRLLSMRQKRTFARGRGLAVERLARLIAVDGAMVSRAGLRRLTLYLTGGVAKSRYNSLGVQHFTVRAKGPSTGEHGCGGPSVRLARCPQRGRLPTLAASGFSRISSITAGDGS